MYVTNDTWEKLKADCAGCMLCPLGGTRHNLVFGVGNERAEIMLIGEGPGEQEDLQGACLLSARPGSCWTACWR